MRQTSVNAAVLGTPCEAGNAGTSNAAAQAKKRDVFRNVSNAASFAFASRGFLRASRSCPERMQPAAVPTTLVLREMQQAQMQQLEASPQDFLAACDVAAFVFDSTSKGFKTFSEAQELLIQVAQLAEDGLPCVLVAARHDQSAPSVGLLSLVTSLTHVCMAVHGHTLPAVPSLSS